MSRISGFSRIQQFFHRHAGKFPSQSKIADALKNTKLSAAAKTKKVAGSFRSKALEVKHSEFGLNAKSKAEALRGVLAVRIPLIKAKVASLAGEERPSPRTERRSSYSEVSDKYEAAEGETVLDRLTEIEEPGEYGRDIENLVEEREALLQSPELTGAKLNVIETKAMEFRDAMLTEELKGRLKEEIGDEVNKLFADLESLKGSDYRQDWSLLKDRAETLRDTAVKERKELRPYGGGREFFGVDGKKTAQETYNTLLTWKEQLDGVVNRAERKLQELAEKEEELQAPTAEVLQKRSLECLTKLHSAFKRVGNLETEADFATFKGELESYQKELGTIQEKAKETDNFSGQISARLEDADRFSKWIMNMAEKSQRDKEAVIEPRSLDGQFRSSQVVREE